MHVRDGKCARLLILLESVLFIGGCATTVVPEPSNITLAEGLIQVSEALRAMNDARRKAQQADARNRYISGLVPAEATVTFNISAKGQDKGSLKIELTPTGSSRGIGFESSLSGERGNTLTIKFTNLMYAGKETMVSTMSVTDLLKKLEALEAGGVPMPSPQ